MILSRAVLRRALVFLLLPGIIISLFAYVSFSFSSTAHGRDSQTSIATPTSEGGFGDHRSGMEISRGASAVLVTPADLDAKVAHLTLSMAALAIVGALVQAVLYERKHRLLSSVSAANRELREWSDMAAAAAEENARLYESATRQRREEQLALWKLSNDLMGTLTPDQVLSRSAEIATSVLAADGCAILTIDDDRDLVFRAAYGWDSQWLGRTVDDGPGSYTATAMVEKLVVRVDDVAREGRYPLPPWLAGSGLVSGLAVPLLLRGEAVGVALVHSCQRYRFSDEKARLLTLIANQTAVALENALLYANEQRHAQELVGALRDLEGTYRTTLEALSAALDTRNTETEEHSQRVTLYTVAVAHAMGVPAEDLLDIERGALLHDVGKIGVPDAILLKPGPLTPDEWAEMERHPLVGYRMLSKIDFLAKALPVVLHHHERFDGTGYPLGMAGEAIPLGARIFAVADALDAMTSHRPYRRGRPFAAAKEEIVRESGRQFDPKVVSAFLSIPDRDWENWLAASVEAIKDILPLLSADRAAAAVA